MRFIVAGDGSDNLSSNGIYALYTDKASRLWIGTRRGGIDMLDERRKNFVTVSHEPGNPNSLSGNFITSVCEMADGNLLVATEGNGLNLVKKTGEVIHYLDNPSEPSSISSNYVNSVFVDHEGKIWLATFTDGICRLDLQTRKLKRYTTINSKTGIENKIFQCLYEDDTKTLWAAALMTGNYFGGLYRYDRAKDTFELFDDKLSDLFSLSEDNKGNLWGGDLTGLVKIDRVNRVHKRFYIGDAVRCILSYGKYLWLGIEGRGLALFDPL